MVVLSKDWKVEVQDVVADHNHHALRVLVKVESSIVSLLMSTDDVSVREKAYRNIFPKVESFDKRNYVDSRLSGITLADLVVRVVSEEAAKWNEVQQQRQMDCSITEGTSTANDILSIEPLCWKTASYGRGNRKKAMEHDLNPFIFERTDAWCDRELLNLYFYLPIIMRKTCDDVSSISDSHIKYSKLLSFLDCVQKVTRVRSMMYLSVIHLQHNIRQQLPSMHAIAFVAEGSILPRKSGASYKPMVSPPAIPFKAPPNSSMSCLLAIEMGDLFSYLPQYVFDSFSMEKLSLYKDEEKGADFKEKMLFGDVTDTCVVISGLLVYEGVTIIVGGGYHGKSTLLRAISTGVHYKVPGDGREFCITVNGATSVRAEDGRYVHGCNISAFISNLPALSASHDLLEGATHIADGTMILKKHEEASDEITRYFKTNEASGSTSQAANVSEAIESGATCMLIDEDVSAANFMARDGRMRALVMDESITPLLYRVNGIFNSLKISTIIVVGGVGDWLDVPNHVIKLDRYVISDATEKARSISAQFSYGHVQYAGRGVVHRLQWENKYMPHNRRPMNANVFSQSLIDIYPGLLSMNFVSACSEEDDDFGFGEINMNRCEQLYGKGSQLFGVGVALKRVLQLSIDDPFKGVKDLLDYLENELDEKGLIGIFKDSDLRECCNSIGFACRPRRHEIAMGLFRLRGLKFIEIPSENVAEQTESEADRRRRELAEIWNNRRKKK